jgi:SAM-dependent methyltransferase
MLPALTVFASALLLFLVQPVSARLILPWFGGSAAVWTTCMVFFQAVLLAGYALAHFSSRLSARQHLWVHLGLLGASLASLPILPSVRFKPEGDASAALGILLLLAATVGLPYLVLSTTSPLVQRWFAKANPGQSPYRLFALSNFASLLSLLGYPFAIEPWLPGSAQARLWSAAYGAFVFLYGTLAVRSLRGPLQSAAASAAPAPANLEEGAAPTPSMKVFWVALAAASSALLFGVTNHLTQNIPSIPLLWVVPLALYLVTFILCFDSSRWYVRPLFLGLISLALPLMAWFLSDASLQLKLVWQVVVFAFGLFVACMVCHGELARRRPAAQHLTGFYLMVSLGGVLGGAAVGLVAPLVFDTYLELPITLVLLALLCALSFRDYGHLALALFVALALGCGLAAGYRRNVLAEDTVAVVRNFYGVLRVKQTGEGDDLHRSLVHGGILHGDQRWSKRDEPSTYYQYSSGIGLALDAQPKGPMKVGVIGLGAGTLAAYGGPGDTFRFYEINPEVPKLARKWFTWLGDSRAAIEIVLGDARLSLEREPPQGFSVLVVDAFSSDAIPVHLITREAVHLYRRHLRPGGTLAFHVSNRYLDLAPVLLKIAEAEGLQIAKVVDDDGGNETRTATDWVLLSEERAVLDDPDVLEKTKPITSSPKWPLWTDDYSNLLQVFRIR